MMADTELDGRWHLLRLRADGELERDFEMLANWFAALDLARLGFEPAAENEDDPRKALG